MPMAPESQAFLKKDRNRNGPHQCLMNQIFSCALDLPVYLGLAYVTIDNIKNRLAARVQYPEYLGG